MPRDLPEICPICSHLTATGDHEFQNVAGHDRPFIICPSYAEFVLDGSSVIVFDQE